MRLNTSKCAVIPVGARNWANHDKTPFFLNTTLETGKIKQVASYKYLGVLLNYKGSFNNHITYLKDRISKRIIAIKRVTKNRIVPQSTSASRLKNAFCL